MGVEPGNHVAVIGDGQYEETWARLDRVEIVAEVPHDLITGDSATTFWNLAIYLTPPSTIGCGFTNFANGTGSI
jgi:hypothetical protein